MLEAILRILTGGHTGSSIIKRKRILVIDDGEVERKFISHTLEKKGAVIHLAADGQQGLTLAANGNIDLVILDYMMPGLTGKDVCRQLKADDKTKTIPVIFLTGSIKPKDIIDCYDVGAEYYLSKPINSRTLIKQVELTLQEIESTRS